MYWDDHLPIFKHAMLVAAQHEQKQLPLGYYKKRFTTKQRLMSANFN